MATVRPHLAPQQPPPPPPPAAAAALPWSPPYRSCRTADAHGRKESVAESCWPTEVANMAISVEVDDGGSDDDGCGSCVDGSEGREAQAEHEEGDNVVWWRQQSSSRGGCFRWASQGGRTTANHVEESDGDGDPKAAAARRQEEDRKFWEECLSSGYP